MADAKSHLDIAETADSPTQITIALDGSMDTLTAPEFQVAIDAIAPEVTSVILDLSDLAYTSSAGLRMILLLQKLMNSRKGSLEIVNVNDNVFEIFELTGFVDLLNISQ